MSLLILMLVVFIGLMLIGVPIAYSMLIAAALPIIFDSAVSMTQMSSIFLQQLTGFTLLAIPLFILAGELLALTGISESLIYISKALVGRVRGSLAHMNVATSVMFGGISGSSVADVATMGRILIPAMEKKGYSKEFSATLQAASSTIDSIIPPSILLIVYGALAQTSVSALFVGGILPGVLIGVVQMGLGYGYAKWKNIDGGAGKRQIAHLDSFSSLESAATVVEEETEQLSKLVALRKAVFPVSLFLLIICGIIFGILTPTEAGAAAAIYVLLYAIVIKRHRGFQGYVDSFKRAASLSASIYVVVAAAALLAWDLAYYRAIDPLLDMVVDADLSPQMLLVAVTIVFVFLGTFMEPNSAMLLFVPVYLPLIHELGINPTLAGIVAVMAIRVGTVTPPYGLGTIVAADIAGTNMVKMLKYTVPFTIFYVLVILVVIWVPSIVTVLPNIFLS